MKSRLRHVQRLRHHAAAVDQEEQDDWVKLQQGTSHDRAVRHALLDPALRHPECDQRRDRQARGNGKSFEVLGLAVGVLGHVAGGDVEARKASETGENKAGKEKLVEASAHAGSKRNHGGSNAEGDLKHSVSWRSRMTGMFSAKTHEIRQRVQLRAHQAALFPPPRDHAVKEVKQQAERHKRQRRPQVSRLVSGTQAVAHGELNRHDATEAVHERDEVGKVVRAD